jgi:FixJ family two-component response regulator
LKMWSAIQSLLARASSRLARKRNSSFRSVTDSEKRASDGTLSIVGLVLDEQDRRLLAGLGSRNQWSMSFAETIQEAQAHSEQLGASVILCDRDMPGREWGATVQALASSPHRPCVLLVSRVVDGYLWNEVVRRGGYDVLAKPLREPDVLRAIKLAGIYWNTARPESARAPGTADAPLSLKK